ncbi:hypothetical protein [Serratia symbiotica]|uniref:hypothetical protein n=1 Tax=Serratia symbiotica TaxID=138074 RepID=UPI0013603214|nr:hypothetical protein [Serratia symbiotica]MBQ0955119.1 hypothetical protein [Serratia symbiotica]
MTTQKVSQVAEAAQGKLWGGNHFWTITGQGDLAAKPSLARHQTGWRFLDYLIENDKKLSFLHYVLDCYDSSLNYFKGRFNIGING